MKNSLKYVRRKVKSNLVLSTNSRKNTNNSRRKGRGRGSGGVSGYCGGQGRGGNHQKRENTRGKSENQDKSKVHISAKNMAIMQSNERTQDEKDNTKQTYPKVM